MLLGNGCLIYFTYPERPYGNSYLQMSGMVFGSMIEADYRLREHESRVRMQKRIQRDRVMWQKFEDEYGKDDED